MADVFISYKSERRPAVEHLARVLENYGFTVWFDYALLSGKQFAPQIEREIRAARAVLVLWCNRSVESEWVKDEARIAKERETLIPISIEETSLPLGFGSLDTVDLSKWDSNPSTGTALDRLLDQITIKVNREPKPNYRALKEQEKYWRVHRKALVDFPLDENTKNLDERWKRQQDETRRLVQLRREEEKRREEERLRVEDKARAALARQEEIRKAAVTWRREQFRALQNRVLAFFSNRTVQIGAGTIWLLAFGAVGVTNMPASNEPISIDGASDSGSDPKADVTAGPSVGAGSAPAVITETIAPDPVAKAESNLLGNWALEGIPCSNPVTFATKGYGSAVSFAGKTSSLTLEPSSANGPNYIFVASNGARYRQDNNGGLWRVVGKDSIRMTKCAS
jgi:hypothetical protein